MNLLLSVLGWIDVDGVVKNEDVNSMLLGRFSNPNEKEQRHEISSMSIIGLCTTAATQSIYSVHYRA